MKNLWIALLSKPFNTSQMYHTPKSELCLLKSLFMSEDVGGWVALT